MSEENPTKKEIKEYIKNNSLAKARNKFGNKAVLLAISSGNTKIQKGPYKVNSDKPGVTLEKGPYKIDPDKRKVKRSPATTTFHDLRKLGLFK